MALTQKKQILEVDMEMQGDTDVKVRPTILVVDDQPENIDVLSNILRQDYKVKAAINGGKALQMLQDRSPPDLILLDIMMPGMDGYEVCRQIKQLQGVRDIPVIFVSALQNVEDRVNAFTSGGVDYITKPVQPEEVQARVRTHIQIKMMQQQLRQANNVLENRVKERTAELEKAYDGLHKSFVQIVESETRYRSLLDAAPDAVVLLGANGVMEMVNNETYAVFGYAEGELVERHIDMLIPPDRNKSRTLVELWNEKDGAVFQTKALLFVAVKKNGDEFPVDVSVKSVTTENTTSLIVDIRDVSEREQLYSQLQQAQKMEAIGHLTGGIAHDFNNMLASILGFTQLAIEVGDDENIKLQEYLGEVNRAGERARDLIAQMLSFSRRNASKVFSRLTVSTLIKEVVNMMRPMLPSSISINSHLANSVQDINADPVKIHQVLMNLCINSRDALAGHGKIDISLSMTSCKAAECSSCHQEVKGEFVEVSIRDNGTGIKKEILHKIFDPFFTTKEVGKGTGMGLSVVHGIMHDHLGHVLLESAPGVGTNIRLLFPPYSDEKKA